MTVVSTINHGPTDPQLFVVLLLSVIMKPEFDCRTVRPNS